MKPFTVIRFTLLMLATVALTATYACAQNQVALSSGLILKLTPGREQLPKPSAPLMWPGQRSLRAVCAPTP